MQIKLNGVMTSRRMLEKLASVLARFETTGLDRVMNVCIELQPPPPDDRHDGVKPRDDAWGLRQLKLEFGPPKPGRHDPEWVEAPTEAVAAAAFADDCLSFGEVVAHHWPEIDIGNHVSEDNAKPVSLVPRLLRAMLTAIPAWDGSMGGNSAIVEFDRPREELDNKSYWEATCDDAGFMRMFSLHLLDPKADAITRKRRGALRNFPMMWQLPMPGVSQELRDMLLTQLGEIVQSRAKAAAIITLRPIRYGKPRIPFGSGLKTEAAASSMTLLEAVFEADNAAEVIRDELQGYRRDWKPTRR